MWRYMVEKRTGDALLCVRVRMATVSFTVSIVGKQRHNMCGVYVGIINASVQYVGVLV
jgi:hypothetical protein